MAAEPRSDRAGRAPTAAWLPWVALGLVVLAGLGPLALYWAWVGRAPSISAAAARQRLSEPGTNAVLVDVRAPAEALAQPVAGAFAWPYAEARRTQAAAAVPAPLQGRTLLLLCSGGVHSAEAALRLAALGAGPVYSVAGGAQAWVAEARGPGAARATPRAEQLLLALAVYPVKLVYMALALGLALLLWRWPGLVAAALRWGLLAFFAGEFFCGVNIVAFYQEAVLLEYLHSWAMVVALGCLAFAGLEAADVGLLRYTDPQARCAFAGLCRGCAKHLPAPCPLVRLFRWTVPMLAGLSLMPLAAQPLAVSYNTTILTLPRNLTHPILIQLYEIRFAPLAALGLLGVAWAALWAHRQAPGALLLAKLFLAAGLGHLAFGFMRLALLAFYRDHLVWFVVWEEVTELMLVASLIVAVAVFAPAWRGRLGRVTAVVLQG